MNRLSRNPPATELFGRVRDYADQIAAKGLSTKKPLKQDATIVLFCQLFFQQFFAYEFDIPIESVDQDTKRQATALRIEQEHDASPEALALVRSFEDLCDMWPDVLGFTYGGLSSEFRRFHTDYLPRLLGRIVNWAASERVADGRLAAVETAAREATKSWDRAAKKL